MTTMKLSCENYKIKIISGKVQIDNIKDFFSLLQHLAHKYGVTLQVMDAEKIAGEEHIKEAVKKAVRAMKRGRNITSDLGLEILLYGSGRRQIEKALEIGVSEGKQKVAVVIVAEDTDLDLNTVTKEIKEKMNIEEDADASFLNLHKDKEERIKKFFDITEKEIKAVGLKKIKKLVLERVAMLDVKK